VRRDHLDAHRRELGVERIAVIRAIADQPLRQLLQEPPRERADDEPLLIGDRSTAAESAEKSIRCRSPVSRPFRNGYLQRRSWDLL
jgi:hypothetical protein